MASVVVAQARLDRALAELPGNDIEADMDPVLAPAIAAIRRGETPEEAAELLLKAIPDMNDEQLQERLARAFFVAELWGQLNVQDSRDAPGS